MQAMYHFVMSSLIVVFSVNLLFAQQATKQDTLKELMRRVNILTEEIEKVKLGDVSEPTYTGEFGMGPAASKVYHRKKNGVSLAGYGEIVYNNFSNKKDDGSPAASSNQIDFLRNIIYLGYRFNDRFIFNSEIEFEHAKVEDGAEGEVAVEFGYLEARINPVLNFRAGMLLMPIGIINELHEPPTFHGSLRPEVEKRIIPATWRANGLGLVGKTPTGIGYKIYLTESLNAAKFSANGIRSGRQEGSKAIAEDLALTGRLNYTGIQGVDVGASFFVGNTGQTLVDSTGSAINAGLSLFAIHAIYARNGLEVRGLYARSSLNDVGRLNRTLGFSGNKSIGETQSGYYVNAAYDVLSVLTKGITQYLAPFIQFEKFNTQDDVPAGFFKNPAQDRTNVTLGLTYKPIPNVAFKIDYLNRDNDANTAVDQFNLAVTYLF